MCLGPPGGQRQAPGFPHSVRLGVITGPSPILAIKGRTKQPRDLGELGPSGLGSPKLLVGAVLARATLGPHVHAPHALARSDPHALAHLQPRDPHGPSHSLLREGGGGRRPEGPRKGRRGSVYTAEGKGHLRPAGPPTRSRTADTRSGTAQLAQPRGPLHRPRAHTAGSRRCLHTQAHPQAGAHGVTCSGAGLAASGDSTNRGPRKERHR